MEWEGSAIGVRFRVEAYDEVISTNDLVKQAILEGTPEGLVVTAKSQTGGYGRRGNRWSSKPGGLYLSFLLRPNVSPKNLQTLSLISAIAVRRTIASFMSEAGCEARSGLRTERDRGVGFCRDFVKIKWPNDVVIMTPSASASAAFQKICGISVEQKAGAVCVGIGINIEHNDDSVEGKRNKPIFLHDLVSADRRPSVDDVRERLITQFGDVYDAWIENGFEVFRGEFMEHFALEGFKIRIDDSGKEAIKCEVLDVNGNGHLIVRPEGASELREIAAGTVTIIG